MNHDQHRFYIELTVHRVLAQHRPREVCANCPPLPADWLVTQIAESGDEQLREFAARHGALP